MNDPRRLIHTAAAVAAGTLLAAACLAVLGWAGVANAAPTAALYVTTTGSDAGVCTIGAPCLTIQRAVVVGGDGDVINVAAGTYAITTPITLTEKLNIQGAGSATTILDGGGTSRIFNIEAGVTISGFNIRNGSSDGGSGIKINVDRNFAGLVGAVNILNNIIQGHVAAGGGFPVGSGIKVDGAIVNVTNNTIQGNNKSAVRINDSAGATFSNNIFQNNISGAQDGAALWVDGNSVFTLTGNAFTGNQGEYGGAIAISKLTNTGLIFSNTLQGNTAAELGGAIYINGVTNTLTISANKILSNTAARGGGIGSSGPSQFLIGNNEIAFNKTTVPSANGGGVRLDLGAGATLEGNQIHHNQAPSGFGGGVDVDNGGATIFSNNQIYNNIVPTSTGGGGVRVTGVASTQFVGNLIYNHTGNGLFVANTASAIISANQILTNSANTSGGGVRIDKVQSFSFSNNTVSNNNVAYIDLGGSPKGLGGGMQVFSSTGTIQGNLFTNNRSGTYDGGGALVISERSTITVKSNMFTGNIAEFGSAIGVIGTTGGSTIIDSNVITSNLQSDPGGQVDGAIEIRTAVGHPITVVNNVLANNFYRNFGGTPVPGTGTAIRCGEGTSSPILLLNNTFYANGDRAVNVAGATPGSPCTATVTLINNILAGHTTRGIDTTAVGAGAIISTSYNVYSSSIDATGGVAGPGNLTANPQFSSAATGDFRLKVGSPAIDAGTNTNAPAKDIQGVTRPFGAKVDAGAYEFTAQISQTLVLNLPASKLATDAPFTVSATYSSSGVATFSVGPAGVCTSAGSTVTPVASGTCVVTGTAPADTNYLSATATGSFPINKASQTVTFVSLPANKLTTDAPFTVTAAFSATGPATFSAGPAGVCTSVGNTVTLVGGGTCAITATVPSDGRYLAGATTANVTVSKAPQTITFDALANKVITDAQFTVVATASSNLSVSFSAGGVCSVNNGVVTLNGVTGVCTITATQTGNSKYLPAADVPNSFNVSDPSKQNQTIRFDNLPATVAEGASVNLSASATSGLTVTFLSLTPAVCVVDGVVANTLAAGTCTIQAAQAGDNQFNPAPGVTKSVTVVALSSSVVTSTVTITGGTLGFVDNDGGSVQIEVPAGAVTGTIELVYADQAAPAQPGTFQFAGRSFSLNAYRDNVLVPDFTFQQPVTVVVQYTDAEIGAIGEATLALFFYDQVIGDWSTAGITVVSRDAVNNRITFQITHLTEFALGGFRQIYLPMVKKS